MDYKQCKERAEFLNGRNQEKGIVYVSCPANIGDCIEYQNQYEKMLNGELPPTDLRKDRNDAYKVWKVKQIISDSITLDWIMPVI